jgi:DNA-binding CsgD family transcriptional regulator
MPTQLHLPTPPAGAQEINAVVAVVRERGDVAYFASGVPVFIHREDDRVGQRVAVAQLVRLGLARQEELSAALDIDRSTLYRHRRKLTAHGIVGVVDVKRGPRGPHRFTPEKRERAARWLAEGLSLRQAAERVGVTEGTIRHARRRGDLGSETGPAASRCIGTPSEPWRGSANCRKPSPGSRRPRPCATAGRSWRCPRS